MIQELNAQIELPFDFGVECFLRSFSWISNIFGKLTYIEIWLLDFRPNYQSQLCFKNWLFRYISTSYKAIAVIFKFYDTRIKCAHITSY